MYKRGNKLLRKREKQNKKLRDTENCEPLSRYLKKFPGRKSIK